MTRATNDRQLNGRARDSCEIGASVFERPGPTLFFRLRRGLVDIWRGLVDAVLPNSCGACGAPTRGAAGVVCAACHRSATALLDVPACARCGRTLPTAALHAEGCARCRTEQFWNIAGVARVGGYTGALPRLVVDLKLRGTQRNAVYLGGLLAAAIRRQAWGSDIELLVPVPSHWLRRWQRPAEHTTLLAEDVSRRLHVPLVRAVERVRASPSQTTIFSKTQRLQNVRGCFDAARPPWWSRRVPAEPKPLAGRTVCIIDNVMYTGATVHEVSKVVRRLGAKGIYAAVVSRPPAIDDPPALNPAE